MFLLRLLDGWEESMLTEREIESLQSTARLGSALVGYFDLF